MDACITGGLKAASLPDRQSKAISLSVWPIGDEDGMLTQFEDCGIGKLSTMQLALAFSDRTSRLSLGRCGGGKG